MRGTITDILEVVSIEIPCSACGGRYEVTLKQVALSQKMLHGGCPVRVETECPPLAYSGLVDQELVQELQSVWARLEEKAHEAGGEVKLRSKQSRE
jgi:hypothetical protein